MGFNSGFKVLSNNIFQLYFDVCLYVSYTKELEQFVIFLFGSYNKYCPGLSKWVIIFRYKRPRQIYQIVQNISAWF